VPRLDLGFAAAGLEINAPTADLLLVFADRDARDRLDATLR